MARAVDFAQDVFQHVLRTGGVQLRTHPAERDSDDIAMVEFCAWTAGGQIEPEFVRQLDVFRPQARRMRAEVEEYDVLLVFEHNFQR